MGYCYSMIKLTEQIKEAKRVLRSNGDKLTGWRFTYLNMNRKDTLKKGDKWVSIKLDVAAEQEAEGQAYKVWLNGLNEIVIDEVI